VSRMDLLAAVLVLLLTLLVRRFHRPWPATVILAGFLVYRDVAADHTAVQVLLHLLIYAVLAGACFWAVDRAPNLGYALGIAAAGFYVLSFMT
jgi:CHASE2 domain-containing sensor protein